MSQVRKVALAAAVVVSLPIFPAFADITEVDASFNGGIVLFPESRMAYAAGSVVAPDTSIYLFGNIDVSGNNTDFAVRKLTPDGMTDTNFGSPDNPGEFRFDFNHFEDNLQALTLLANGEIVLGGFSANVGNTPATFDPHLIKIEVDGDAYEWGTDISGKMNEVFRLQAQSDGKVLVLGDYWTYPNGPGNGAKVVGALIRLNVDGTIDTNFGDNGRVVFGTGSNTYFTTREIALSVDASDRILIGYSYFESGQRATLLRLLANGQNDSSFPAQTIIGSGNTLNSRGLLIDAMDGNAIYWLLDEETASNIITYRVAKFGANGNRDNSFARTADNRPSSSHNVFTQMPDGKLLIAGDANGDILISRLGWDGQPDTTFGTGGFRSMSWGVSFAASLHRLNNENLLVSGHYGGTPGQSMYATRLLGYDLEPDNLTVPEKVEVAPGSTQFFGPVTITGTDGGTVNGSNAEFYLTTAPSCDQTAIYSNSDKRFATNDGICLKHVAAATLETRTVSSLNVNGKRVTFSSVTEVPDTTPNTFSFTAVDNVAINTRVESNSIIVSGINTPTAISVTNGEYRIDAGAWTQASGTVISGQSVSVRHTTNATFTTPTSSTLSIGSVTADFISTTEAEDAVPDAFSFLNQDSVQKNTVISSSAVTPGGFNTPVSISVAGGEYSINGGAFTASASQLTPGQSVVVRHTSANVASTSVSTTITIGGTTASFTSTTKADESGGGGGGGSLNWLSAALLLLLGRRRK